MMKFTQRCVIENTIANPMIPSHLSKAPQRLSRIQNSNKRSCSRFDCMTSNRHDSFLLLPISSHNRLKKLLRRWRSIGNGVRPSLNRCMNRFIRFSAGCNQRSSRVFRADFFYNFRRAVCTAICRPPISAPVMAACRSYHSAPERQILCGRGGIPACSVCGEE